jgi:hypothetical protein
VCSNEQGQLRRLVCNIGTTGTSRGHSITHRAMAGLFQEVGLSPNFVWDKAFEVPTKHMPLEHRKALEEARLDNTVDTIKRAQRGMQVLPG